VQIAHRSADILFGNQLPLVIINREAETHSPDGNLCHRRPISVTQYPDIPSRLAKSFAILVQYIQVLGQAIVIQGTI
jgi:hypothetical protein